MSPMEEINWRLMRINCLSRIIEDITHSRITAHIQSCIRLESKEIHILLTLTQSPFPRGAFSECRLALHKKTLQKVVIKHIHLDYVLPQYKSSIQNEFNILSQLKHPNIVGLFEVYSIHGDYFMVLPLLRHPLFLTIPSICFLLGHGISLWWGTL
jgi:hypothetical protein